MRTNTYISAPGPGRPRDNTIDQRVLATTAKLFNEGGFRNVKVDEVAQMSKTSKASIYRRWPSVTHLVVSMLIDRCPDLSFEITDDPVQDFENLVPTAIRLVANPDKLLGEIALDVKATGDEELIDTFYSELIAPIRDHMVEISKHGQKIGVFREDIEPEWLFDFFLAPLINRSLHHREDVTEEIVKEHASNVMKVLKAQ